MKLRLSTVLLLIALISACTTPQTKTVSDRHRATVTSEKTLSKPIQTPDLKKRPPREFPEKISQPEDLWGLLIRDQAFSRHTSNPRIKPYLARYTNKPSQFYRFTEPAALYLPYVVAQLKKHKMPAELALIPFIESSYNPFAYSHSGAAGLWQFIPSTAKHLGLEINWWYDGRRDILASTETALRYLRYLHSRFNNDWMLAMAAYNGGEGTVSKAIRKNRTKGLPVDYWSLDLPPETTAYVPHFLALVNIINDPASYGLKLSKLDTAIDFELVELDQQIDLQQAAQLANLDIDSFYRLNPGFLRWASPPSGPFSLLLPKPSVKTFNAQIAQIPKTSWLASQRHTVKLGETLSGIARSYHTSVEMVVRANNLTSMMIIDGQQLKIPAGTSRASLAGTNNRPAVSSDKPASTHNHRVLTGDTLSDIAKKYQVSLKSLLQWNQWPITKPIKPGQNLVIAPAG